MKHAPGTVAITALVVLQAWQAAQAGPPRATLNLLPTLGGPASIALGLNDQGWVVGASVDANAVERGFVWTAQGGMQAITTPRGQARAVNALGQVAGWEWQEGAARPFVWDAATGLRHLPTAYGIGQANAINDLGLVAGWQRDSAAYEPTLWQAGAGPRWLAAGRDLTGLNEHGQAVGSTGGPEAYFWQADGSRQVLLPLHGGDRLIAAAGLNNQGQVVGRTQLPGAGERYTAYLWDSAQGMRDLGHLGGGQSAALAIADSGQVVGTASVAGGEARATLWTAGRGMVNLNGFASAGTTLVTANAINGHAQVAGLAANAGGDRAFLLTLHPDWTGGDGHWDDTTGQRWNWAGTGTAAAQVGAMHDVVIDPGRSATVWGSADGSARTLRIGGTAGHAVVLDLNGGSTRTGDGRAAIYNPTVVATGGVLQGHGRLDVAEDLQVQAGGRVQVGAGQTMRLGVDYLDNQGLIRAQGGPTQQARLELSGGSLYNQAGGQIQAVHADLVLNSALVNFGQISLQGAQLTMARPGIDGQLSNFGHIGVSFGDSVINGHIVNRGLLVVSNGARASFHGEVDNVGELRVSAGGAANFFGPVSAGGSITGGGQVRFEAELSPGGPTAQALQIDPETQLAGSVQMRLDEAGAADHISFTRAVLLDGATLRFEWGAGAAATAGLVVDLFDWQGGLSGSFSGLALPALAGGLAWDTSDLYRGGSLAVAAVPEPQAWALLLAGLGLLALRRRGGEMAG